MSSDINKLKMVKLRISEKKKDEIVTSPISPETNNNSKKRLSLPVESSFCARCLETGQQDCVHKNPETACVRCSQLGLECSFETGKKKRTSWSETSTFNFTPNFEQNLIWHMDFLDFPGESVPYYENKRHSLKDEDAKLEVERLEKLIEEQRQEIAQLKNGNSMKKKEIVKQVEQIRDFSKTPFSLGFEKSTLPMIFTSTNGQILSYNESFAKVFGFGSKDIVVSTIHLNDIIRKEDCETFYNAMERSMSLKEKKFKIAVKSKDGFKKYIFSFEIMVEEFKQTAIACFAIIAV